MLNATSGLRLCKGKLDLSEVLAVQKTLDSTSTLAIPELVPYVAVIQSPKYLTFTCAAACDSLGDWVNAEQLRNIPERVALRVVACVARVLLALHSRGYVHNFLEPRAIDVFVPGLAIATRAERPPGHKSAGAANLDEETAFEHIPVRIGRFPLKRKLFVMQRNLFLRDFPAVAPEVINGMDSGMLADVWSLGRLLAHLVGAEELSAASRSLVDRSIKVDADKRLTLGEFVTDVAFSAARANGPIERAKHEMRGFEPMSVQAMIEALRRRKRRIECDSPARSIAERDKSSTPIEEEDETTASSSTSDPSTDPPTDETDDSLSEN